ncbi:cohesin domain-containing protein [Archaeoglobus neptunius]|uniref:cohesin domain-containing protein n=1 Tax=Archaeoglobus neptunius TaxID=2798580 RepID=UPI001927554E|nr:cohesin domain-containing protein [Archaeoglobus neptunius]
MKWIVPVIFLIILLVPVHALEVHIFIDKNSVNLGDEIRIQVSAEKVNRTMDIYIVSSTGDGKLLCHLDENESVSDVCGQNITFRIPEDWKEGTYLVKVLVNDVEPEEHFEEFEVIKPKIKDVDIPELVYQGKTRVKVYVETANSEGTKVKMRMVGDNTDYIYEEKTPDFEKEKNVYEADMVLNLREFYERTRDISDAIKPGSYILDLEVEYGGRVWDSRRIPVSIVSPEIEISCPDKISIGNPIVVDIKTNRLNDYNYDGIIAVLAGTNFLMYKKVHLGEDGKARLQFETAGLDSGKYTLYLRDTSETSTISYRDLAENYYDLDPNNGYAKIIQAEDDVLVSKQIWLMNEENSRATKVSFSPSKVEVFRGKDIELSVILGEAIKVTSYQFVLLSSSDAVKIESITTPDGFKLLEKSVHPDYAEINAVSYGENQTSILAKILVKAAKTGEATLRLSNVKLYGKNGSLLDTDVSGADIVVLKPAPSSGGLNVNVSILNETNNKTVKEEGNNPPPAATDVTASTTPEVLEQNVMDIDFRKVFMFMASFLLTYYAGKFVSKRIADRRSQGKR